MFTWKNNYLWDFSDEGRSDPDKGPAITGSKMFRGGQYKNVVRETVQNGADARDPSLPADTPVKMCFEYILIERQDVPGIERLSAVIDKCYSYMKSKPNVKMDDIEILEAANEKYLKNADKIPALKISDYNTKGLTKIDYLSLMKSEGLTFKTDEDTSGSFGFGKFAPYLLSPVNTLLYSSCTGEDQYLFQGRTFLSTFEDEGKRKRGTSLFGQISPDGKDLLPISNPDDVPEVYRRDAKGTDLFILCFEKTAGWMDQMVFSVLENFFFAVYLNKLEVSIKENDAELIISKETLPDIMQEYATKYEQEYGEAAEKFEFSAPKYWKVLNDARTVTVPIKDFRGKGEVILHVLMGEEIEDRTVLQMRSSGMKIQEDSNFRRLPPFNGIMIATGKGKEDADYKGNISKFLREMESPAHDSWRTEDVKKEDIKSEAKQVIDELHKWIRDTVKAQIPPDDGSPVDAFGLNKILPDVTEAGAETIEEDALFNFVPLPVDQKDGKNPNPKRPLKKKKNGRGKKKDPDPKPRPVPDPDDPPRKRNNKQRDQIIAKPVKLSLVRTPYISEQKLFRVSLITEESVQELMLKIRVIGDDASKFDFSIAKVRSQGRRVSMKDGFVIIPDVTKGEKVICEVTPSEARPSALEVVAYAKQ